MMISVESCGLCEEILNVPWPLRVYHAHIKIPLMVALVSNHPVSFKMFELNGVMFVNGRCQLGLVIS